MREIFEAALAQPAGERLAYLVTACGSDVELREQVERMVHSHERATSFLETRADLSSLDTANTGFEGRRLGPYQLISRLGTGGMGVVFKALDTRLNRTVAIKVLPPYAADNSQARERFEREACAIAALNLAPTSTPLPTVAVPLPSVSLGGFNLTTTLRSATGPQSCAVNIGHMHVGDSYDAWLLTIARSDASINLVVSDRRNPSERYEYEGTVVGDVVTAEMENYSVGAGWCGGRVTFTNESYLSGRFSEDGRTFAAEVVDSIRLNSSGEEIELHFD